jgi:hypothetical protein
MEVDECNNRAIEIKKQKIEEEKQLESKIVEYNRIKALREEELAAE